MSREVVIRLASFIAVSLAMAAWETVAPPRQRIISRVIRWPANLGILAFDTALVRLLFAALPVAVAVKTQEQGWGLLNAYHLPFWMKVVCGVILLDSNASTPICPEAVEAMRPGDGSGGPRSRPCATASWRGSEGSSERR